jgi:hypothetical protein
MGGNSLRRKHYETPAYILQNPRYCLALPLFCALHLQGKLTKNLQAPKVPPSRQ